MYMAELAPASIRGGLVNFYQSWLYVGGVLASATVYASTTHLDGEWAYMTRKRMSLDMGIIQPRQL